MIRFFKDCILRGLSLIDSFRFRNDRVVFLPRIPNGVGGPRTFLTLLCNRLQDSGIHVTHNKYVAVTKALIPIQCDLGLLRSLKKRGVSIVQRLDGLFYDSETGAFDHKRNDGIGDLYLEFADTIVFQSEYSRLQCEHFLGNSAVGDQRIICNGTDLNCFYPSEKVRETDDKWILVTTGNFRDRTMLFPILAALDALYHQTQTFEWKVIGPILETDWEASLQRPYIRLMGALGRDEIASELRSSDLYIFSFLNPNCPNSIIEATASGLPVVSFSSGALTELCDFSLELLADTSDEVIHTESSFDPVALLDRIQFAFDYYSEFRQRSIANRSRFDINESVASYLKVLEETP